MPTLHGMLPDQPGPTAPCRWCGQPTDLAFAPEGSRIGPVPLHILCSGAFILAYERWRRGNVLDSRTMKRLAAVGGHAAVSDSATVLQRPQTIL